VPRWTEAQAARTRIFSLDMGTMGMGMGLGRRSMAGMMALYARGMSMARINVGVPLAVRATPPSSCRKRGRLRL
jgi:hypothetical protein